MSLRVWAVVTINKDAGLTPPQQLSLAVAELLTLLLLVTLPSCRFLAAHAVSSGNK